LLPAAAGPESDIFISLLLAQGPAQGPRPAQGPAQGSQHQLHFPVRPEHLALLHLNQIRLGREGQVQDPAVQAWKETAGPELALLLAAHLEMVQATSPRPVYSHSQLAPAQAP
jgi:hypothetical protein